MRRVFSKARKILSEIKERAIGVLHPVSVETAVKQLELQGRGKGRKILYITNKYDYADRARGLGYEHYQFYLTLVNLDCEILYFPYDELKQRFGKKKMSRILQKAIASYQPDMLLYYHYLDWVDHVVWKEASHNPKVKTVIMLGDDYWRHEETRPIWTLFNVVVTMDKYSYEKRVSEGFKNVFLSQWAINHFIYKDEGLSRIYDVVFVGQAYGKRPGIISELRNYGVDIKTFGRGWPGSKRISQTEMISIYNQGKIVFNSFITSKDNLGINSRDFEAASCGALCVTQDIEEIRQFFIPGKEAVMYGTLKEAAEKIQYYLNHEKEREQIARSGQRRVLQDHTYEKRFKEIFAFADTVKK